MVSSKDERESYKMKQLTNNGLKGKELFAWRGHYLWYYNKSQWSCNYSGISFWRFTWWNHKF
jgi:hypothetical protein